MTVIQNNPAMFDSRLPIHIVTVIDHSSGLVTLNGSDGSSFTVALNSWGNSPDTQPLVGSKVQLLHK